MQQQLALSRYRRVPLVVCMAALISGCKWMERVSVDSLGNQANAELHGQFPAVSRDGRYLTFATLAALSAEDTDALPDVYLRDTLNSTTRLVSLNDSGGPGNSIGIWNGVSADGRYATFASRQAIVPADTNGKTDVYVRDMQTGDLTRVSVKSDGTESAEGGDFTGESEISDDGRYVAFTYFGDDLVDDDTNGAPDIFVHDRNTGETTRVSVDDNGNQGDDDSIWARLSADGNHIAFSSAATNLVPGDTNLRRDVFVHNRLTAVTTRVSVHSDGSEGNNGASGAAISGDGRFIAFTSFSSNLVDDDTNSTGDVFVRDTQAGTTTRVSVASDGTQGNDRSEYPSISDDGRYVGFISRADNLVPDDTNGAYDIFVHDRLVGRTWRVSRDALGVEGNSHSIRVELSGDGRYAAFRTEADNLVPGDSNGLADMIITALPQLSIADISPNILTRGATTPVTISGTGFLPGVIPEIHGVNFSNVVVANDSTITAHAEVPSPGATGAQWLNLWLPGTGPGTATGAAAFCENCVTLAP